MVNDICNVILGSLKGEQPAEIRLVVDLALDALYEFQPLAEAKILVPEHLSETTVMAVPTLRGGAEDRILGTYRGAQFVESDEEIELTLKIGAQNEA